MAAGWLLVVVVYAVLMEGGRWVFLILFFFNSKSNLFSKTNYLSPKKLKLICVLAGLCAPPGVKQDDFKAVLEKGMSGEKSEKLNRFVILFFYKI